MQEFPGIIESVDLILDKDSFDPVQSCDFLYCRSILAGFMQDATTLVRYTRVRRWVTENMQVPIIETQHSIN